MSMLSRHVASSRTQKLLLAGAILVAGYVAYQLAFRKTVELYQANQRLEERIARAQSAPAQLHYFGRRAEKMETVLSRYQSDSLRNQSYLLARVGDFCQERNILLKEFPQAVVSEQGQRTVATSIIKAEGRFADLLALTHQLEKSGWAGRVASVSYQSHWDYRRNAHVLELTLYLQNIKAVP